MKILVLIVAVMVSSCLSAEPKKYLTDRDIKLIKEYWPDYEYAAKLVGVPVCALAAIHYRESSLYKGRYSSRRKKVVKNIGGPFMLDLGPRDDAEEFIRRIRAHEKKMNRIYCGYEKAPKISHDFRFAAIVAAHELKSKLRCSQWNLDCMADALWGYNGRATWCKMTESPYLWSNPKAETKLISRYKKRDGTLVKYLDTRPGVMILYKEIYDLMGEGNL